MSQLGPWPVGMNNIRPEYSLPSDQNGAVIALRNAVNVDLDVAGNARRRAGYTKVIGGLNTRCGYSCPVGTFYLDGANLMRLNDNDTATLMFSGLAGNVSFEYFNGIVYLSDGTVNKRIVNGAVTGWPIDSHLASDPEYMAVPAGSIIRQYNGRIYVAKDKIVWFTDPFTVGSVQKQRNFIQFPATVTIMEPTTSGIWFVSNTTEFYAGGGPDEFIPRQALPYGAVPGTSVPVPNSKNIMWYSDRGAVMATPDGQIKNIQEANIAAESGTSGAALIREENGIKQFIASVRNQGISPLAASSFMDMEVIRKQGA